MRLTPTVYGLAVITLWFPAPLRAQDSLQPTAAAPRVCFRGRPLPACSGFWLTEFSIAARLTPEDRGDGPLGTWELGWMKNAGTHQAYGAAIFAELAEDGAGWGIRPRYRRWLNPVVAFDIAPGIFVRYSEGNSAALSGHVGLSFGDYFAFTSTVQLVHRRPRSTTYGPMGSPEPPRPSALRPAWFAGGRLGALPGTIAGIAVPVGVIALLLIACGGGGCFST